MEAAHAALLRRSLTYLEQTLNIDDVLAGLLEDGVLSSAESEACLAPGVPQNRRRAMVELLMTKTDAGYRSFCAILDRVQPDVKEMLDRTADGEGATSLIYCNRHQLEEAHRKELQRRDEDVAELKKKVAKLEELIQALTLNEEQPLVVVEEQTGNASDDQHVKFEGCVLSTSSGCDVSQLVLLPCMHAVCLPCIVHHDKQEVTCEDHEDTQEVTSEDEDTQEVTSEDEDTQKMTSEDEDTQKMTSEDEDTKEVTSEDEDTQKMTSEDEDTQEVTIEDEDTQKMTSEDKDTQEVTSEDHENIQEVARVDKLDTQEATFGDEEVTSEDNDDTEEVTCVKEIQQMTCACGKRVNWNQYLSRDFVRRNELGYENYLSKGDVCTYCESHQSSSVCTNCNVHLCSDCRRVHDGIKMHKNHVVKALDINIPIEKWLKDAPCKDHSSQPVDLYDMECRKPICNLCVHEGHKHDSNTSLKIAADNARTTMNSLIESETRKISYIQDRLSAVARHQDELRIVHNDLRRTVIDLRNDLATWILRRQNQLQEEITQSFAVCMETVQKQKNQLESAEASATSTVNYIHRAVKSTTQAQLVAVVQAIQRKVDRDQEIELPPEDTRDTKVRVSIQGQRALHDLIDKFGCLYTPVTEEDLGDTQGSLEISLYQLKDKLEAMKLNQSIEYRDLIATLAAVNIGVMSIRLPVTLVSYPNMTFDVNQTEFCFFNNNRSLQNKEQLNKSSGHFYQGTRGQIKSCLTMSQLPLYPQYWEVHAEVAGWCEGGRPVLEVCVLYGSIWVNSWIHGMKNSWVVAVVWCDKHHTYCVTPYIEDLRGECSPILSLRSGSVTTLQYGVVVDVRRGRVAIVDIAQWRVVLNCSVAIKDFIPMFGLCEPSDGFKVKMKLLCQNDIVMPETKKALIHEVLSTNT